MKRRLALGIVVLLAFAVTTAREQPFRDRDVSSRIVRAQEAEEPADASGSEPDVTEPQSTETPAASSIGTWVPVPAPPNGQISGAEWIRVTGPEDTAQLAAVFRPSGNGPFPPVVFLHGHDGFGREQLGVAQQLAREGFVVLAGCWFRGHTGSPREPIDCDAAPLIDMRTAQLTLEGSRGVVSLMAAAKTLPGARADRLGLFATSWGGMAAFLVAASGQEVGAIVGVNPVPPPMTTAETLNAPVLLLHGTADQVVNVQSTRDYEQALRAAGRLVEAFYYEGLGHALVYDRRTQQDVLRRGSSFLRQYLSA